VALVVVSEVFFSFSLASAAASSSSSWSIFVILWVVALDFA
jgi:hypothetical protein